MLILSGVSSGPFAILTFQSFGFFYNGPWWDLLHKLWWPNRQYKILAETTVCSGEPSHNLVRVRVFLYTLYGRKNSLLARRKLDRFPYLQYSTTTISGPGGADAFINGGGAATHRQATRQRSPGSPLGLVQAPTRFTTFR